jgi:aryl-alcohol dehydrogenase-like predicted oxidoreductase
MHHAGDYTPENVFKLDFLKSNKQISKYGLSVYDPEDVPSSHFDVIQFPLSLLDQRFLPQIKGWKARGVEVWARSCFLRGVLLADPTALPPYFDPIQRRLSLLPKNPVARLSILLNFVYNSEVDYSILGFKDQKELTLALDCLQGLKNNEFATVDCIDPRRWVRG